MIDYLYFRAIFATQFNNQIAINCYGFAIRFAAKEPRHSQEISGHFTKGIPHDELMDELRSIIAEAEQKKSA